VRDAHQKRWIAERCEYHHTHFDAFNELFIAYYELVAMCGSNMIPGDEEEEGTEDRERMEDERAADEDGRASASDVEREEARGRIIVGQLHTAREFMSGAQLDAVDDEAAAQHSGACIWCDLTAA
jgi:hypothetical protein